MADKENYRVAIDILCCHLGMSFEEACAELGLNDEAVQKTNNNADLKPTSMDFLTKDPL